MEVTRAIPEKREAGRALEAEIQREVFGDDVWACNDGTGDWLIRGKDGEDYIIPPYSTDMGAAWKVQERFWEWIGFYLNLERTIFEAVGISDDRMWTATFTGPMNDNGDEIDFWERAATAPLAICRTALEVAVWANQPDEDDDSEPSE